MMRKKWNILSSSSNGMAKTRNPTKILVRRLFDVYLRPYFRNLWVAIGFMVLEAAMKASALVVEKRSVCDFQYVSDVVEKYRRFAFVP
jgi:hypothetical protein